MFLLFFNYESMTCTLHNLNFNIMEPILGLIKSTADVNQVIVRLSYYTELILTIHVSLGLKCSCCAKEFAKVKGDCS